MIMPHRSYLFTFWWPFRWFPIGTVTISTAVNFLEGVSLSTIWPVSQADVSPTCPKSLYPELPNRA